MKLMEMMSIGPVVVGIEVMEVVGVDIGVMRVDRVMVAEVELLGARSVGRGRSSSSPCGMGVVRSSSRKGQRSHVAYSRRGHQGGLQRTLCLLNHILSLVTITCHRLCPDPIATLYFSLVRPCTGLKFLSLTQNLRSRCSVCVQAYLDPDWFA